MAPIPSQPGIIPTPALLERFQEGDQTGYEVLFQRYQGALQRFVTRRTDPAFLRVVTADDLLQEAHLQAIRGLSEGRFTYRRELSFFFWLCGILKNLIAQHCRRLCREPPRVSARKRSPGTPSSQDILTSIKSPIRSPDDLASLRESLELLALAFSQLPDRRRTAVILRYFEGHGSTAAAAIMETTPGAFRVLLTRALLQLRTHLDAIIDP